ncbi:DUF3040 domain-containing protein [Amycolatopsis thermoflava]|uniref:DUF3040 domain-containing protein n=1 Tax=Amycolatopsis thermoflava TaxID=84480 RepID=UPI003825EB79
MLSPEEQRELEAIERELEAADPVLARALRRGRARVRWNRRMVRMGFGVAGVVLLTAGICSQNLVLVFAACQTLSFTACLLVTAKDGVHARAPERRWVAQVPHHRPTATSSPARSGGQEIGQHHDLSAGTSGAQQTGNPEENGTRG